MNWRPGRDPASDQHRVVIRDVARITHHSEEAYAGALAIVVAMGLSSRSSQVPGDLLQAVASILPDTRVRDRILELHVFDGSAGDAAARFGNTGYVVEAVPLAMFIAARDRMQDVETILAGAISVGGDTDTIAALVGQIVGATGMEPQPAILSQIAGIAGIETVFDRFAASIARGSR